MRSWMGIVIGLIVVAVFVALLLATPKEPAATPTDEQPLVEEPEMRTSVGAVQHELPVQLTSQFFSPAEINLTNGDTVTLVITSVDTDHVVYYGNATRAPQGSPVRITLSPTTGDHQVSCTDQCVAGVAFTVHVQ